jgi:predicted RNA-binding Zn-ribbon protein involved in translation (DUF1610 family)
MEKFNCPKCGAEMEQGKVNIESTFFGVLLAGVSYKHLFFINENGEKIIVVNNNDDPKESHKCTSCDSVFIEYIEKTTYITAQ